MSAGNFLNNFLTFREFSTEVYFKTIGEKISPDKWAMGSQEVNAYYNPVSNEIVFPVAILRFPFYDIGLPITYNYGGIGMVVGHEILHGFDTQGSKFDSKGLLREWWTKSSRDEYLRKTQCIIDQYAGYSINNTPAANSKIEVREKLTLPGVDLSPEQLFYVGMGRSWCAIVTKRFLDEQLKRDVHSVWKYRINGPMSNMPEFSKVFNCSRNKKMNRQKKCLVW